MTRYCTKLWLLVWKNWLLQVRHVWVTLFQILLPVLLVLSVFIIRMFVDVEPHPDVTRFPAYNPSNPTLIGRGARGAFSRNASSRPPAPWEVAWCTQDSAPSSFVNDSQKVMKIASVGIMPLRQFSSPVEMEEYMRTSARLRHDIPGNKTVTLAGVVLADEADPAAPKVCSRRLKVTLRFPSELRMKGEENVDDNWSTGSNFRRFQSPGPRDKETPTGPFPSYTKEGFTALQAQVSRAVAMLCAKPPRRRRHLLPGEAPRRRRQPSPAAFGPDFRLRQISYPPYDDDELPAYIPELLSTILIIGFVVTFVFTTKSLTEEKARQIKETLKIIGVPTSLHWIAWFIKTMSLLLVTMVLVVVILKIPTSNGAILKHSSLIVVFIFFVLFAAALTFFAFMLSSIFSNANLAAACAAVFYLTLYVLFSINSQQTFSLVKTLLLCLSCPGALGVGVFIILKHEDMDAGQQWKNLWSYPTSDYPVAMGVVWLFLLLNCLMYMLITLYIDAILPGEYGMAKPWNFLCQKSFWRPKPPEEAVVNPLPHAADRRNVEDEPTGLRAGVRINAVSKVFPGNKLAVNNLSLNMYEDQITVLLGHNGAGKTTTISMITGMTSPTSGTVTVSGYDIRSHTQKAREGMGFCPQHNLLFEELTVKEHIYFFAKLKGLTGNELKEEIDLFLKLIQMEDKRNKQARTLSGGMKRKLAVCMALCGHSKVVFLDEPTSGMDPAARRALWDLLREEKAGRTLLLTTHMMDEADVLGDRIAIMAGGRLQCYGSPYFLKKRFSGGYHLVVVKGQRCNTGHITKLLSKHIKNLKIAREAGFEIVYQLDEAQTALFEPMLADLEKNTSQLDVITFGVSLTTMEEVFLKVSKEYEHMEPAARSERTSLTRQSITTKNVPRVTGRKLLCNQVRAMCLKKNVVARRGWLLLVIHLLAPAVILLLVYLVMRITTGIKMLPELSMVPESWKNKKTVIAVGSGDKSMSKNFQDLATDGTWTVIVLDNETSPSDAFEKRMLDQYNADRGEIRESYHVGASFEEKQITGWFNNYPFHAVPLILNMLYNAHLKSSGISLNIVNHPLPYTAKSQALLLMRRSGQVSLPITLGMIVLSSYFILFPIKERSNNAKHMQIASGANVLIFWGVHFVFDFVCFVAACVLVIIILAILQLEYYSTRDELGRTFAVLICCACGSLPFVYLWSLIFRSPATGYAILAGIGCVGIVMYVTTKVILILEVTEKVPEGVSNTLQWIFSVVPIFTLLDALGNLEKYTKYSDLCAKVKIDCSKIKENFCCPGKCPKTGCVETPPQYFQWASPGIGKDILLFFLWYLIFFIILLLIDSHMLNNCLVYLHRCCVGIVLVFKKQKHDEEMLEEDEDVLIEKQKVSSLSETQLKEYSVVLRGVTKYFRDFRAVNNIYIAVEKGEIFGLLGANGAGKTSTFKMMTGDVSITKGEGFLMRYNIQKQIRKVHKTVGYCPQFDALIDVMTVRETLEMYLLLRGYPYKVISRETRNISKNLKLREHVDKKVKDCSGGNKRKLSLAIALIGDPPLVFLDEPTAGMDPGIRRQVWDVVMEIRESGNSVILTTHSMEECEVLCTRLAIMVNGSFRCLGPIQHLKNKFAAGYTLIIKVNEGDNLPQRIIKVKEFISRTFPGAVLKQEYVRLLTYHIPSKTYPWSKMFGIMEKARRKLDIEDYSLGQTSLEQVFLHLASLQRV